MKNYLLPCLIALVSLSISYKSLMAQDVAVEDIDFKGNKQISSGKLEKAIKTQANPWYRFFLFWKKSKIFDNGVFLDDLLRIEKYYHQEGFLQARVTDYKLNYNKEGDEVNIVIYIEEGKPTIVERTEFLPSDGVSLPFNRQKLLGQVILKHGKRYREPDLTQDYNKLTESFNNNGYPYIEARVKPLIDNSKHSAVLEWYLNPGPFSRFGEVTVSGNQSVSSKVIRRGLGFKAGQEFQQKKLIIAQSQIYQLELFQYVNIRTQNLKEEPTTIPIEVQVKERDFRTLKLGVGYGTEESFRASLSWRHRNFLGGARILALGIQHSTNILPLDVNLQLSQPFFLDNQNDLLFRPFFTLQDEKSFKARRIGVETTFNRQMTPSTVFLITSRIERDTVEVKGEIPDTTTVIGGGTSAEPLSSLYNKSILQFGVRRSTTDELFTPSTGSVTTLLAQEAGLFLKSRFKFYKFSVEYKKYFPVDNGVIFASRFFVGTMNPFGGSPATPIEERFFAGGSFSVRGWERQELGPKNAEGVPIGGNSDLEGSLELRYPIYKAFGGAIFLDYGNVWSSWNGYDLLGLHYSIGSGLRYMTPIGPFRLDFAWKINKQAPTEENYQIHISIGQAF